MSDIKKPLSEGLRECALDQASPLMDDFADRAAALEAELEDAQAAFADIDAANKQLTDKLRAAEAERDNLRRLLKGEYDERARVHVCRQCGEPAIWPMK